MKQAFSLRRAGLAIALSVASGVSPDVEGGILPPGPASRVVQGYARATPSPPRKMGDSTAGETPAATTLDRAGRLVVPPPMPRRSISPSTNAPMGESLALEDNGVKFTLIIPPGWSAAAAGKTVLAAHFHTTIWFVIQEHLRRQSKDPLLCFQLGEGSTIYRQAFEDTNRFSRVLRLVEQELRKRGAPADARVTAVDVSSFSAGYGAVRELIKSPAYFQIIRRIVLLDSMYAGLEETTANPTNRRPASAQINVWAPFARAAITGQKTFLLTHSAVPTGNYASSSECAAALLQVLGVSRDPVAPGALPATADPEFPLRFRSDSANFHIWGYDGQDAQAHMTHARHLAEVWQALDSAGQPPHH